MSSQLIVCLNHILKQYRWPKWWTQLKPYKTIQTTSTNETEKYKINCKSNLGTPNARGFKGALKVSTLTLIGLQTHRDSKLHSEVPAAAGGNQAGHYHKAWGNKLRLWLLQQQQIVCTQRRGFGFIFTIALVFNGFVCFLNFFKQHLLHFLYNMCYKKALVLYKYFPLTLGGNLNQVQVQTFSWTSCHLQDEPATRHIHSSSLSKSRQLMVALR